MLLSIIICFSLQVATFENRSPVIYLTEVGISERVGTSVLDIIIIIIIKKKTMMTI